MLTDVSCLTRAASGGRDALAENVVPLESWLKARNSYWTPRILRRAEGSESSGLERKR